jgi:hypothetical protein
MKIRRLALGLAFAAALGLGQPVAAGAETPPAGVDAAAGCGAEWCSGGFYRHPLTCSSEGDWFLNSANEGWRRYTCRYSSTTDPHYHLWLSQNATGNDAPWG